MKKKIRTISRIQYFNSRYSIVGYLGSSQVTQTTPPPENLLITESGDFISTESGDLIKT
jgi:hypothetical protein